MSKRGGTITLEIDPADYGYFVEALTFDEYEVRAIFRVFDLAEEAVRALKGQPLALALRDSLDRIAPVIRQLEQTE